MITSKDDSATASLLGFAIANRVDAATLGGAKDDNGSEFVTKGSAKGTSKEESKDSKDQAVKEKTKD